MGLSTSAFQKVVMIPFKFNGVMTTFRKAEFDTPLVLYLFWERGIQSQQKKDKKIPGKKTLKTWKNHGKIMEFCWSAAVGTLKLEQIVQLASQV